MTTLLFEYEPDPIVFAEKFAAVEAALEDTLPPMLAASEYAQADIRDRFYTETDPEGDPWAAWAESYVDFAESFPNAGILRQTELMFEAAQAQEAFVVTANTLFYDTSGLPPYAEFHESGTHKMPARPFIGLSDHAEALIQSTFVEWFDRAIDLFVTTKGRLGRRHALRGGTGQFIPRRTPLPSRIGL